MQSCLLETERVAFPLVHPPHSTVRALHSVRARHGLCVLAAASSGCMNHFLASREDQVAVVKMLCESIDTEGAAESLRLMIDAGCFVELQGPRAVPPVVVVLQNASQYSTHKEIVDQLLRRCDMDKV